MPVGRMRTKLSEMKKSKGRRPTDVEVFEDPAVPGPVPAVGLPYTVFFPVNGTLHPADLEHASQLPRHGDVVEYIDEHGACHRFEVAEVIHTLQLSAGRRPRVREESIPNAFARDENEPAEAPGDGGLLRAGLPKVILRSAAEPAGATREESGFRVRLTGQPAQAADTGGSPRNRRAGKTAPAAEAVETVPTPQAEQATETRQAAQTRRPRRAARPAGTRRVRSQESKRG